MANPQNGKGSKRRPTHLTLKIQDLRYSLVYGSDWERADARRLLEELGEIQPTKPEDNNE